MAQATARVLWPWRPSDEQELPIQLILAQSLMRDEVKFNPVKAQFALSAGAQPLTDPAGPALWRALNPAA
jgi:hypothetical protein